VAASTAATASRATPLTASNSERGDRREAAPGGRDRGGEVSHHGATGRIGGRQRRVAGRRRAATHGGEAAADPDARAVRRDQEAEHAPVGGGVPGQHGGVGNGHPGGVAPRLAADMTEAAAEVDRGAIGSDFEGLAAQVDARAGGAGGLGIPRQHRAGRQIAGREPAAQQFERIAGQCPGRPRMLEAPGQVDDVADHLQILDRTVEQAGGRG